MSQSAAWAKGGVTGLVFLVVMSIIDNNGPTTTIVHIFGLGLRLDVLLGALITSILAPAIFLVGGWVGRWMMGKKRVLIIRFPGPFGSTRNLTFPKHIRRSIFWYFGVVFTNTSGKVERVHQLHLAIRRKGEPSNNIRPKTGKVFLGPGREDLHGDIPSDFNLEPNGVMEGVLIFEEVVLFKGDPMPGMTIVCFDSRHHRYTFPVSAKMLNDESKFHKRG